MKKLLLALVAVFGLLMGCNGEYCDTVADKMLNGGGEIDFCLPGHLEKFTECRGYLGDSKYILVSDVLAEWCAMVWQRNLMPEREE